MTTLPSYPEFEKALEFLIRERCRISPHDAYKIIADMLKLTPAQRNLMRRDGRGRLFHNMIQWAREKLAKRGVIDRKIRGIWVLRSDQQTSLRNR